MLRRPQSALATGTTSIDRVARPARTSRTAPGMHLRVDLLRHSKIKAENVPLAEQRLPKFQQEFAAIKERCNIESCSTGIAYIENAYTVTSLSHRNRCLIPGNIQHLKTKIAQLESFNKTLKLWLVALPRDAAITYRLTDLAQDVTALLAQMQDFLNRLGKIESALAAEEDYPNHLRQLQRLKDATNLSLLTAYAETIDTQFEHGRPFTRAEAQQLGSTIEQARDWQTLFINFETTLNYVLGIVPAESLIYKRFNLIVRDTQAYINTLQMPETHQALSACVQKLRVIKLDLDAQTNLQQHAHTVANIERNLDVAAITTFLEENQARITVHNNMPPLEYRRLQQAINTYSRLCLQTSKLLAELKQECQHYAEGSVFAAVYAERIKQVESADSTANHFHHKLLDQQTSFENSFAKAFAVINEKLNPTLLHQEIEMLDQTVPADETEVAASIKTIFDRYDELLAALESLEAQVDTIDAMMVAARKELPTWIKLRKAIADSIDAILEFQDSLEDLSAEKCGMETSSHAPTPENLVVETSPRLGCS